MILETFRVTNFRSVSDSSTIDVDGRITALLGRNESGKSNLLLALRSLNPVEGFTKLNPTKDFPRNRRKSECNEDTPVVATVWLLSEAERAELTNISHRFSKVEKVGIQRNFGDKRPVSFPGLVPLAFNDEYASKAVQEIVDCLTPVINDLAEDKREAFAAAIAAFSKACGRQDTVRKRAESIVAALGNLKTACEASGGKPPATYDAIATSLNTGANELLAHKETIERAQKYILERLPLFIYLDEYPELDGHQNIAEFLKRRGQSPRTDADLNFEKLCKVAEISPDELEQLRNQGRAEDRGLITNRASAVVTRELRRLWKDRKLKVRFAVDGEYFDTLVSDPTSDFDVEVNLNERSRGLRWFFSFYITFAADTAGGKAENAIILLDEPGLFLHIESQKDLQRHFEGDFANQIIYTTHSPFMVPVQALDRLRTVNVSEDGGTVVTNNPTGDGLTLAPIRAALGYTAADSLLYGPDNLVVEGVTDSWILEGVSKHFISAGKSGIGRDVHLPSVDGAPKAPTMVSFLSSHRLNVVVLFDDEKEARAIREEMVKKRQLKEHQVIFVSEAFEDPRPSEADIEDLIDPAVYAALVQESYADELTGKTLELNPKIPRIVKRMEDGFAKLGIPFHKTRPAGLFFRKLPSDPNAMLTPESAKRFERLFQIISQCVTKVRSSPKA